MYTHLYPAGTIDIVPSKGGVLISEVVLYAASPSSWNHTKSKGQQFLD